MKILDYKSSTFANDLKVACEPVALSSNIPSAVSDVIAQVRAKGDSAVFAFTKKFDGVEISKDTLKVSDAEFKSAQKKVSSADKKAMREAIACVKQYNLRSKPKNWRAKNPHGAVEGESFYPIKRVGLYIPGGNAPLVSTVVMTATLAKIAGCPEICVCTPPAKDGSINSHILCVLAMLGIKEVYKVGGAQAIASMGVGTESIKAVDKLYGPGNAFVIEAKRQLFGEVGCDLLPGPSEVLILADASANAKYIASDLLSQAEHGSGKEKIFFITTSKKLISSVQKEIDKLAQSLSRAEKLKKIIDDGCYVVLVPNLEAGVEVANYVAPEHMEIQVAQPEKLVGKLTTAGAVLVGENTPTVLGDFTAGPSHTLPTGRTGRFSGGLQVVDFMRRSSYVKYDKKSLAKAKDVVVAFGKMESLDAHYKSLLERI
jgi:histidinol dehydrogenase